MRPLHIGLLVVGAAMAGGIAVKMTEPQPIPFSATAPTPPPVSLPVATPTPAPGPVEKDLPPQPAKPTPMPDPPLPAPSPAYAVAASRTPAIHINKPKSAPVRTVWSSSLPQVAEAKPLPVYNSPPQFVPEPVREPVAETAPAPTVQPPVEAPPVVLPPHHVTLWTGTPIAVRIDESLSSDHNAGGDSFNASLSDPLVVDGLVIAERGAHVSGRVVNSQKAGRISGSSFLELSLSAIMTSDGQRVAISTEPWTQRGDPSRGADAAMVGGGAAVGAIIGAIAGGGKGAAIGAGAGGAAGAGAAIASHGKPAGVSTETIIRFRLASAVTITERR